MEVLTAGKMGRPSTSQSAADMLETPPSLTPSSLGTAGLRSSRHSTSFRTTRTICEAALLHPPPLFPSPSVCFLHPVRTGDNFEKVQRVATTSYTRRKKSDTPSLPPSLLSLASLVHRCVAWTNQQNREREISGRLHGSALILAHVSRKSMRRVVDTYVNRCADFVFSRRRMKKHKTSGPRPRPNTPCTETSSSTQRNILLPTFPCSPQPPPSSLRPTHLASSPPPPRFPPRRPPPLSCPRSPHQSFEAFAENLLH